ncbi:ABC transporter ATP-binding protein [Nonomuraea sp. NPDC048826]|uniref:ABC transporter ATP-binding protein n=1 Tax=Nonomuraea sp. NPDC048826 TaxID=3364347 RepID=UPI0037152510
MTHVRLSDVTRTHGEGAATVHALQHVTLEAGTGELLAVMGPSGSGKSTLLNLAGGLDRPTSGTVHIGEHDLATVRDLAALRRRTVGYVFQDLNLIPSLTAAENVMLPRELDGARPRRARQEAMTALADIGVDHLADRFPDELSGGQRQRVAIARALIGERRLLLADEPTGALDTGAGDDILRILRERADAGATVLLVTHEPRYAAWADRVVFLRDGRIADTTDTTGTPLTSTR